MPDKRLLMPKIIIAIDGYSGTGKSSTAKKVAERLSYTYIDSGAMYRAITYFLTSSDIDIENREAVQMAIDDCEIAFDDQGVLLNGLNIEDQIRTMDVNRNVSAVSAISVVRRKLVSEQRRMSEDKGVVMDGRDIGTVVFPKAELKVFMTADLDIRVERRKVQLESKNLFESGDEIRANLLHRDKIDTTRDDSPLRKADDAIEIDTSTLTMEGQVQKIVLLAKERSH